MTRDDADREEDADDGPDPVPDTDPQHIDPAGDLADAVESGELDLSLADSQDAEDRRPHSNGTPYLPDEPKGMHRDTFDDFLADVRAAEDEWGNSSSGSVTTGV